MSFARLERGHVIAALAAFVLLFVMAVDWYGTVTGDEARRVEQTAQPKGAEAGEVEREVAADARITAESAERNAWQPFAFVDQVILVGLLATIVLAIAAAYLRAADKRIAPPFTPSTLVAVAGLITAVLIAYRTLQRPGFDEATTIKVGPPLALILLGILALASRSVMRSEGVIDTEPVAEPEPAA